MAWVHLLGRKFADVLGDPEFDLLLHWPYWNRFGREGCSYYACCHGRRFCMSQSKRKGPDAVANLARVFRRGGSIDTRVGPFYCNRKGQLGLLVAAWNGSQWLQMLDPQPLYLDGGQKLTDTHLQELEDVLKTLRGRTDFQW